MISFVAKQFSLSENVSVTYMLSSLSFHSLSLTLSLFHTHFGLLKVWQLKLSVVEWTGAVLCQEKFFLNSINIGKYFAKGFTVINLCVSFFVCELLLKKPYGGVRGRTSFYVYNNLLIKLIFESVSDSDWHLWVSLWVDCIKIMWLFFLQVRR